MKSIKGPRKFTSLPQLAVSALGIFLAITGVSFAQTTDRVSVTSSGGQGNARSDTPSISEDGRFVAFQSKATNLAPGDTNGHKDIFVHDRRTGVIERVSVDSSGRQGNSESRDSSISDDGRFIAFRSSSTDLVPGDTNGADDVFIHDRQTGLTVRVSENSSGSEGNDESADPSISHNGRFVTFHSDATNLVPGDTNGCADVFVHDRQTKATERVSINSIGGQGNGNSYRPSISDDSRFVAFLSEATNLVLGDTAGNIDIFVHDRQIGATERVSVDSSGLQGNSHSFYPTVSGDGRFVTFHSYANNLVAGDTNGWTDVFVHDRLKGTTERVSVDSNGEQANASSYDSSISEYGRFVAFQSKATDLIPEDTNGTVDIFVYDRQKGVTERVSVDSNDGQGNSHSAFPSISDDGRFVAFDSQATNLVPGDTNGHLDIFIRDRLDRGGNGSDPNHINTSVRYDSGHPVQGTKVEIYDSSGTHILDSGYVGFDGLCLLELDPGNYLVRTSVNYENHGSTFTSYNWHGSTSKEIVELTGSHSAEVQIQLPNPAITLPGLQAPGSQASEYTWEMGANYWRAGWDHAQDGLQKMAAGYRSHIVLELWEDQADPSTPGYDGYTSHLAQNGQNLGDFLAFAIQENPTLAGIPFQLVGHSMGGLYSRSYISDLAGMSIPGGGIYPTIRRLVAVGSPNLGTILATDLAQHSTVLPPAIQDLSTVNMAKFNLTTPPDASLRWSLIAGTGGWNILEGWPNDNWVGAWSVGAPETEYPSASIGYEEFPYSHSDLHDEDLVLNRIIQLLEAPLFQYDLPGAFAPPPPPEPSPLQINAALAANGQPVATSIPFQVDDSTTVAFHFQWSQGNVTTEVIDPAGASVPITASYSDEGMRSDRYLVNAPLPGIFIMKVLGTTDLPVAGEVVSTSVIFDDGPVLTIWADPEQIGSGTSTQLLAEPMEFGAPLPALTVSAMATDPAGNSAGPITLYDDGLHGDGASGDGRYGEVFTPATTGRHMIKGIVTGQRSTSALFERHGTAHVDVAAGSVSLTGIFQDAGRDFNGNGAFEELVVTAELDITIPSTYQVVGVLGQAGVEIDRQTTRAEVLSSGLLNAELNFNGTAIYRSGIDGPYSLMELSVYDETTGLILELTAVDVHVTAGYLHSDFEAPAGPSLVSLSPNFGDIGGGEEILLAGSAFNEPGLEIWFGDRQADVLEVLTEGQIRVRVPAPGPSGAGSGGPPKKIGGLSKTRHTVDVRLVTLYGEDMILRAYTYMR